MRDIPHPILGFFGLIRDWVDLDLLAEVAKRRPDWHIVLLGDADSNVNLSAYRGTANMHFLGRRPYASLPAYCRCFDVGLIPFKVNELTKSVNPIKLREYLAAGLPVVSTPLPEVQGRMPFTVTAAGGEGFVKAIERLLDEEPLHTKRRERAETMLNEDWPAKVETVGFHLAASSSRLAEGAKRNPCDKPHGFEEVEYSPNA